MMGGRSQLKTMLCRSWVYTWFYERKGAHEPWIDFYPGRLNGLEREGLEHKPLGHKIGTERRNMYCG